eukprot:CAMPEP_0198294766 /NCGR_PEP_ID=MMETSP1449-20131203/24181_1 /TAXON_ID=420275 /ORGANISM="Attheya septentrionalis, Strain CCMP2084" /LENGTH=139 /DNA_ID=CAMNT_0043994827 /DNA_START=81 /DNA_END=500 /DNA_ORIENTATION=+
MTRETVTSTYAEEPSHREDHGQHCCSGTVLFPANMVPVFHHRHGSSSGTGTQVIGPFRDEVGEKKDTSTTKLLAGGNNRVVDRVEDIAPDGTKLIKTKWVSSSGITTFVWSKEKEDEEPQYGIGGLIHRLSSRKRMVHA